LAQDSCERATMHRSWKDRMQDAYGEPPGWSCPVPGTTAGTDTLGSPIPGMGDRCGLDADLLALLPSEKYGCAHCNSPIGADNPVYLFQDAMFCSSPCQRAHERGDDPFDRASSRRSSCGAASDHGSESTRPSTEWSPLPTGFRHPSLSPPLVSERPRMPARQASFGVPGVVDFVLQAEGADPSTAADLAAEDAGPGWGPATPGARCSATDPVLSSTPARLSDKIGKVVETLQTRISSVTTMASLSAGKLPSSMPTGWSSWSGASDDSSYCEDGLYPDVPGVESNLQNAWSSAIFGDL